MKRSKFSDQQIVFILRQAEEGTRVEEVCLPPRTGVVRQWRGSRRFKSESGRTTAKRDLAAGDAAEKTGVILNALLRPGLMPRLSPEVRRLIRPGEPCSDSGIPHSPFRTPFVCPQFQRFPHHRRP